MTSRLETIGGSLIVVIFLLACYQQITSEVKAACDGGATSACSIYRTMKLPD